MAFNKKKIKIKKTNEFFWNFIWAITIVIVFFIWFFLLKAAGNINFDNFSSGISYDWKLSSSSHYAKSWKINILITWRGGGNHDAPNLTDTIILASLDTRENILTMLSIPRDLYVEYPNKKTWKINEIYRRFSKQYWSDKLWMKALENKIYEITWEKTDFYIDLDFKGFIQLVDTFWWVEVNVPKQFVDEKYPDWKLGYTTFILRKWTWNLDWKVALKYVRSRHSTSDFDRSLRQQQVISSLKNKILNKGFFENIYNIKKLYGIFNNYINTDMDLKTMLKLGFIWKKMHNLKILSFNLNDSCFYWTDICDTGWFLYDPDRSSYNGAAVLLPYWVDKNNLNNYKSLHKFTNLIFNHRDIYKNKYKINVLNSIKVNFLASEVADSIKKYWFNIPKVNSIGNTWKYFKNSTIYYNGISENSETIKVLKKFFSWKFEKKSTVVYWNENDVKIEIIIWEDYKKVFNF